MSDVTDKFDVVIIGGGPGGYVAAIRLAQLGFSCACIDERGNLGGTCLNIGCIPSKALLHASELYHKARHEFKGLGIDARVKLDLSAMMERKSEIVSDLTRGIEFLFQKNKIEFISGRGRFVSDSQVSVEDSAGSVRHVSGTHFIIATGSLSADLPGVSVDEKHIVSSTGALSFASVPESLVVIGGGVIGLELGSVWNRLGSRVEVIEFMDSIVPHLDNSVSKQFMRILEKQGMIFHLGHKVSGVKKSGGKLKVSAESARGGKQLSISCDKVLVAIGRRPNTEDLGLDAAGVVKDERGFISVDGSLRTSNSRIYAIGDCVPGPMLAHKAEEDGVYVAEILAGERPELHYDLVPGVIYTHPEVAHVGYSEAALKERGVSYKVGRFMLPANSRARANSETDGFVKIFSDSETDRVLGAVIISPCAGEMIHEVSVLLAFGGSSEDLSRVCHGHPTYSESVKEACLSVLGRAIHS